MKKIVLFLFVLLGTGITTSILAQDNRAFDTEEVQLADYVELNPSISFDEIYYDGVDLFGFDKSTISEQICGYTIKEEVHTGDGPYTQHRFFEVNNRKKTTKKTNFVFKKILVNQATVLGVFDDKHCIGYFHPEEEESRWKLAYFYDEGRLLPPNKQLAYNSLL